MNIVTNNPLGLLILAESLERFSYFFVAFLIPTFMVTSIESGGLGLSHQFSTQYSSYFSMGILILPLVLAPIIDKFFGYLKAAFYGGVLLLVGYCLAFLASYLFSYLIVIALIFLVFGSAFVKPSIAVLFGKYAGTSHKKQEFSYLTFIVVVSISSILSAYFSAKMINEVLSFKPLFLVSSILMLLFNVIMFYIAKKEKYNLKNNVPVHLPQASPQILAYALLFCLLIGISTSVSGKIFAFPNTLYFWMVAFSLMFICLLCFLKRLINTSKFQYYLLLVFCFFLIYAFNNLFLTEIGSVSPIIPSLFSTFDMLNNFLVFPLCLAFIFRFSSGKALATMQALAFFLFSLATLLVKNVFVLYPVSPSAKLIFLAILSIFIFLSFILLLKKIAQT